MTRQLRQYLKANAKKNKTNNKQSDIEAEKDGYEEEGTGGIKVILTKIFDEMKDLKNYMRKITSKYSELRKLIGAWENQWQDEKREIHLKLKELENKIKQ